MQFLFDAIRQHAQDHADRLALRDDRGTRIPYGALPPIVDSIALNVLDAGLEPGQTVAMATPANSNLGLLASLGTLRAGMILAIADVKLMEQAGVVPDAVLALRAPARPGARNVIAVGADWMTHPDAQTATARLAAIAPPDPIAVIFSSSGTTGEHKLIPMGTEAVKNKVVEKDLPRHATLGQLNMLSPLSPMGLSVDYSAFYHGKTMIRMGSDSHRHMNIFTDKQIESVYTTSFEFGKLIEFAERYDLSSIEHVKYFYTGGSMLSRATLEKGLTRLSKHIYFSYGVTEVSRITISDLNEMPDIPGAVGKIEARAVIDVLDDNGAVLPRYRDGRIRIRVPVEHRALGYIWEDNKVTPFPDEYFIPGDIGHVTDDNIMVIKGRETEIASVGGNKISLVGIESLFLEYPYVSEAAAVTSTNVHGFDDILVAVVPKAESEFSLEELRAFLRSRRKPWVEKDIVVTDGIPRNESGKIDRASVKKDIFGLPAPD